jgi:hypothetical protein
VNHDGFRCNRHPLAGLAIDLNLSEQHTCQPKRTASLVRSSQVNQSSRRSPLRSPLRLLQVFGRYFKLLYRPLSNTSRLCVPLWTPIGFGLFFSFNSRNPLLDRRYILVARQRKRLTSRDEFSTTGEATTYWTWLKKLLKKVIRSLPLG